MSPALLVILLAFPGALPPGEALCLPSPAAFVETLRATPTGFQTGIPAAPQWRELVAFWVGGERFDVLRVDEWPSGRLEISTSPRPVSESCFSLRAVEAATYVPGLIFADGFEYGLGGWDAAKGRPQEGGKR